MEASITPIDTQADCGVNIIEFPPALLEVASVIAHFSNVKLATSSFSKLRIDQFENRIEMSPYSRKLRVDSDLLDDLPCSPYLAFRVTEAQKFT